VADFVVALDNISITSDISVTKDDVGIVKSADSSHSNVFFIKVWQEVRVPNSKIEHFEVDETGDAYDKKICNVCSKLLPTTTMFQRNQNGVGNRPVRRPSCNTCRQIIDGVSMPALERAKWLQVKPKKGDPFECPICHKKSIAWVTAKLVLDHNHLTGEGRAWLCDSCNTGLGRFKDDIALLQSAIKFLE